MVVYLVWEDLVDSQELLGIYASEALAEARIAEHNDDSLYITIEDVRGGSA